MNKRALITGILGQDGSYLADFLLEKDYKIYGILPQRNHWDFKNVAHIENKINFEVGDMCDLGSLKRVIYKCKPHEIYNLAAQSFVKTSWEQPTYVTNVNGLGCLRLLEILKDMTGIKLYQASTSEMFGNVDHIPQNEETSFSPVSPYGISKLFAHNMVKCYRESYKMFCCSGILFNHESPRRGEQFVTQKIVKAVINIKNKQQDVLQLGNLSSRRDFGHAKDYVEAMWLMLQQDDPKDYVIATGETASIEDVVAYCFHRVDLNWKDYVKTDIKLYRPNELNTLCGDASLAKKQLNWEPTYSWREVLKEMLRVCDNN